MTTLPTWLPRTLRILVQRPAVAIPCIAGLVIGIGASSAVFSVFWALELESMGFTEPARLVSVWLTDPAHGQPQVELSYGDWRAMQSGGAGVGDTALASSVNLDFTLFFHDVPEHVDGTTVTGNFFRVLGAKPLAGRLLDDGDDQPGAPLRIVISNKLFQTQFGGDRKVVGRQVRFSGSTATVVGIARPEFDFPSGVTVWAPLHPSWPDVEKSSWIGVFRSVARLAPGISAAQALQRLDRALQQDSSRPRSSPRLGATLKPIREEAYGPARTAAVMLLGAVLLLLLIACANAANLMLALHAERTGEFALHAALGAGRWRIVRMLMSESVSIAVCGGLGGLLLAQLAIAAFARWAPSETPAIDRITLNWPVALFGLALSALTVLLFSAVPAWVASQTDPATALGSGNLRAVGGISHAFVRRLLIGTEVAFSAMLVFGGILILRSYSNLAALEPGFQPDHVLTFRITTELAEQPARRALYRQVLDRVRSLPGVESAGAVLLRPLGGAVGWDTEYAADVQSPSDQKTNPTGNYEAISPGYFRTLRIPMLAGRDFGPLDTNAVIVNRVAARRLWPDGNAVGRRLRLGPKTIWLTVVGVVGDVRYRNWTAVEPDFYIPYTQRAQHRSDFVVRTYGDPLRLVNSVRQEVMAIDKNQPISNVTTMDTLVEDALGRARVTSTLLSVVASCAAGLAAIGIYGLLSYSVQRRTREIGLYMALGATPRQVASLVSREIVGVVASGIVIGMCGAAVLANLLRSQFVGVDIFDAAIFGMVAAMLLLLAGVAAAIPAWRAASIDPAVALRE